MAIATFTITQGLLSKVIWENAPLWSLNYEVFYYLLFIPISFFNLGGIKVLVSSLLIAVISHYIFPDFPILSSYFFGFLFWSAGWCVAKYFNQHKKEVGYNFLLGGLFYILSISALLDNCGLNKKALLLISKVFVYPATSNWATVMIPVQDVLLLPYCFYLVIMFSGINFKYRNQLFLILQIPPLFGIYHIFRFGAGDKSLICIIFYYSIALALFLLNNALSNKFSSFVIKSGTRLGSISYGIYVIHFPILYLFGRFTFLSGSPIFFMAKIFLYVLITILVSEFLEKVYQVWVKRWFQLKK